MTYKVIIPPTVREELKSIAKYIFEENPDRAVTFIRELRTYFMKRFVDMPLSGKIVKGKIRMLPYKRYIILYAVNEKQKLVSILHIFAGGQDWENYI